MESKNHKVIKNFISSDEKTEIIDWVNSIGVINQSITNHHIKEVRKTLNGNSFMFDVSETKETTAICKFQSSDNIITEGYPEVIDNIIERISEKVKISKNRVFFQVVDMNTGGKINPHYDATVDGFINYKCNVSVLSDDYKFYIDKDIMDINEGDLYCFEASLYKHWSNEFKSRRILLSFGFVLSYSELNRTDDDPRVRLSKRIQKYFQS